MNSSEGVSTEVLHTNGHERRRQERRQRNLPVASERRKGNDRRRHVDPVTFEREYNAEQINFMMAMDQFRRKTGCAYPEWSQVLSVVHALGYRKIAEPAPLPGLNGEATSLRPSESGLVSTSAHLPLS